jgi:hypothetical protein
MIKADANKADARFLLSNWDNTAKDTVYNSTPSDTYASTCIFDLKPDIPKSSVQSGGEDLDNNRVTINVQRAVAKISLKISAPQPTPNTYDSDGNGGDKGRFTPWVSTANDGRWALGNINKTATVFQEFSGGSVADKNYARIEVGAPGDEWYKNFDNLRVFGAGKTYGSDALTVTAVRTAMLASQAATADSNSVSIGSNVYMYCTENAQSYAQGYQENSTYAVVGGTYQPKSYITNIIQAAVVSNAPITYYNGVDPNANPGTSGQVFPGTDYAAVSYSTSPTPDMDTLYYHAEYKIFFLGKQNVLRYYAWSLITPRLTTADASLASDPGLIAAVQADFDSKKLVKYHQGNCFYRVFIKDNDSRVAANEHVLVRRNHIYDINITKILGPGIADPNDLINPGTSVNASDTYMSVEIAIQKWHKIEQEEEVTGK